MCLIFRCLNSMIVVCLFLGIIAIPHAHADAAAKQAKQEECWRQLQQCSNDDQPLSTYFLSLQNPHISTEVTTADAKRADITRLLIRLEQSGVNPHMPVVTASIDPGTVHDVINTWDWLQSYAAAHTAAKTNRIRPYPLPGVVFKTASALALTDEPNPTIAQAVKAEQQLNLRWTHKAAPSAMLLLPGQRTSAVGDVQYVSKDGDAIVLTIDIVHKPQTFSEFKPHGLQYHDSRAHYHFHPPAGVELDAAKFLQKLPQDPTTIPGLFIYMKGLPDFQWFWHLLEKTATQ